MWRRRQRAKKAMKEAEAESRWLRNSLLAASLTSTPKWVWPDQSIYVSKETKGEERARQRKKQRKLKSQVCKRRHKGGRQQLKKNKYSHGIRR